MTACPVGAAWCALNAATLSPTLSRTPPCATTACPAGAAWCAPKSCNPATHPVAFLVSLHSQYPLCAGLVDLGFLPHSTFCNSCNLHRCYLVALPQLLQ